ncbi:MAG: M20 family metallopeptidase [Planctomycetota bacterium]
MGRPTTNIDTDALEALLADLVGLYSPSGKEQEIGDYLLRRLQGLGIPVECQPVDEERYNLVVRPRGREARLLLTGHIDTVTASAPDQCEPRRDGDDLVGLGTADMKGGCAALLEAYVAAYLQRDGELDAELALVVGEEEYGDGTTALIQYGPPPLAVVAEPTDLAVCLDHYGYLEAALETIGVRRHAAEASREHNAVYSMLRVLARLADVFERSAGEIVFNIRDLQSSSAGFAVPDRCSAWLDLHAPPAADPEALAEQVREVVARADEDLPGTLPAPRFPCCHRGYGLGADEPHVRALRDSVDACHLPWRTASFRSHSDANLLAAAGCRPVVFGPGRLSYAHTTAERTSLAQVAQAARVYRALLERF